MILCWMLRPRNSLIRWQIFDEKGSIPYLIDNVEKSFKRVVKSEYDLCTVKLCSILVESPDICQVFEELTALTKVYEELGFVFLLEHGFY